MQWGCQGTWKIHESTQQNMFCVHAAVLWRARAYRVHACVGACMSAVDHNIQQPTSTIPDVHAEHSIIQAEPGCERPERV